MEHQVKKEHWMSGYIVPVVAALFFIFLFIIAIYRFYQSSNELASTLIADHIQQLTTIFKKIDAECKIIDFEHEKNYIDFLTVKSFVGSEVGAMNLTYPQFWKGPYLNDNPTIQEQQYVIITTPHGYYVAPGDGVKLANGKVIGTDIILNSSTNFEQLLQDPNGLLHKNRPLAAKIKGPEPMNSRPLPYEMPEV